MKKLFCASGLALATLALASAGADAKMNCEASIEAMSGPQKALTSAYDNVTPAQIKRSQDRAFAKGKAEAIAAWQAKVGRSCPTGSSFWFRAREKSVEICDQAMGGRFTVCARAIPARRLGR